ncbi:MAG: Uncharacterized protein G01um101438_491 [Parcubacteria group bacterium Gr01-1014_38]|nr:MAG: Uncharacterized protein G01um101438_491 [Parcubacteria group bacterium Gr01-1014_38]
MPSSQSTAPVLRIPASDDLPDILEKIQRVPAPHVVIDCRQHPVLRADPLVRRLLQATAADFGKDITFQLADRAVRHATVSADQRGPRERAGSSSFRRRRLLPGGPRELPLLPWRRFPIVTPRGRATLAVFAVLTGMLLTGVVTFVVPRARVRLVLATEPFAADLTLRLDASVREPQRDTGTHPARLLRIEEAVEEEFPVHTTVEKGARAEGVVDIVNQTAAQQGIKARTRLQGTSGVVVRTQRDVIVPALGRASVAVRAEEGGSKANLDPQRLVIPALPAESRRLLYGEIVRPLHGGTDRLVRQLATTDVERGTTALRENAERKLLELIQREARTAPTPHSRQEQVSFSRPELSRVVVGEAEISPPVGTDAESFRIRTTVRGEAFTADAASLQAFLTDLLQQRIGNEKDPVRKSSFEDLRVVDVRWDHGRTEFSLHSETPLIPRLNFDELRERLQGRTADDAAAFLRAIPGVRTAEVRLSPVWIKRIPSLRRNIHIDVATQP